MNLVATFTAAMRIWDAQKADGIGLPDRITALGTALQLSWPQVREWKYTCRQCDDYGLVMAVCDGDASCGRAKRHLSHEFGTACWCSAGQRFRDKKAPTAEDFTSAGKAKPAQKMTRFGR